MHTVNQLQKLTDRLWDEYAEIFPKLVRFDSPKIRLNNRFTKTAGCNWAEQNLIDMSSKFLAKFPSNMLKVILPHEIAHQIDFNLNGWTDKRKHHDKYWQIIMVDIGEMPNLYHTMVL